MTSDRSDVGKRPDTRLGNRLSIDDWLTAGYAILAEDGIKALKIDRLCARLDVTKGSFYWHFDNMATYRTALIRGWGELRDADRSQLEAIGTLPPRDRLSQMMRSLVSPRHWTLERAMREWARSDEAVAESVRAADRRILAAVRQAFEDYGFDADKAELRADATFAVGIGFLHLSGPSPHPRLAARSERFLDLMLAT
ncbi:TetR/AcrR family transcriptional regulator [Mycobacterium sp. CBMA293]|uniref:TetR/AcrR family transcriptional regulator n=1 Tax=unclassified Mycolicibacterium TaxID=2636767 RepID=UPI00132851CC|nr:MULTISPECIES: TetR/AcrR family transcriptional regulator [unclassified Mycolicibacterium]MUL46460.1 TetR/AcrR family transcriptional regulator [Mycolicibacterium sp. CBMA 360]MUL92116.1 TetR/AcrR family transcriptional regulator [Mycolicibacterium sp. CBMA 230]MUM32731.1 TetR/AcrR family transcriptional regulator [Mycolicibacterium sp. CBMA 361]MUL57028.1 TetR/AcrR family transcriptional regulator [Mycolicibacterium sp. CBMA 335]MUL70068.1 TetR/AcrR family transcriptional regulator [Mycolic